MIDIPVYVFVLLGVFLLMKSVSTVFSLYYAIVEVRRAQAAMDQLVKLTENNQKQAPMMYGYGGGSYFGSGGSENLH